MLSTSWTVLLGRDASSTLLARSSTSVAFVNVAYVVQEEEVQLTRPVAILVVGTAKEIRSFIRTIVTKRIAAAKRGGG